MKPNQMLELAAVPLAGIFLISTLLAFSISHRPPRGVNFTVMQLDAYEANRCPDNLLFVSLQTGGRIRINSSTVQPGELTSRLKNIMSYRNAHSVYVIADPLVSESEFADFLDQIAASASNMHIGLLPVSIRKTLEKDPLAACRLDWPAHEIDAEWHKR